MKKNGKRTSDLSPQRFLSNAKEALGKSGIELGQYTDAKYVAEASGIAYLAALNAIVNYAEAKGFLKGERPKSYEGISHLIDRLPQRNKLHIKYKNVYDLLHTGGYYNQFAKVSVIKEGIKEAEEIIRMLN